MLERRVGDHLKQESLIYELVIVKLQIQNLVREHGELLHDSGEPHFAEGIVKSGSICKPFAYSIG